MEPIMLWWGTFRGTELTTIELLLLRFIEKKEKKLA